MTYTPVETPRRLVLAASLAFAAYGAYWGAWGASVPRVQRQAGIDDGALGIALLFIGAGAPPAMLLMGRALDHWGLRVAAAGIAALGVAGLGMALTADGLAGLCLGLVVVGAVSGAADVAINAVAGRAETASGRPVITRAHGVFSAFVVLGSLATGLSSGADLPLAAPFAVVAVLSVAAGALLLAWLPGGIPRGEPAGLARQTRPPTQRGDGRRVTPFVLVGALGALAFASENAHQSWSAVFADDVLRSGPGLSAVAPAVFAGTVAVTRFAAGGLGAAHARTTLLAGASAAAAGALVIAAASSLAVAAVGLALAAAGTAVLYPTLMGIVSRTASESHRGRATSVVTMVSYLGFIVGPVYVGLWSDAVGLRGAMVAVAALGAALVLLTPRLLR